MCARCVRAGVRALTCWRAEDSRLRPVVEWTAGAIVDNQWSNLGEEVDDDADLNARVCVCVRECAQVAQVARVA